MGVMWHIPYLWVMQGLFHQTVGPLVWSLEVEFRA